MAGLLKLYETALRAGKPFLKHLLRTRMKNGKEEPGRIGERMGQPAMPRPAGRIIWVHAASVGEAQSALILINSLASIIRDPKILVTTGTVTSATLMERRLPPFAFHQYVPLDHPEWVQSFLDHWEPDIALWMESELWPNILLSLKRRGVPAVLVNARLSDKSFRNWSMAPKAAKEILGCFTLVLAQTPVYADRFRALGAPDVAVTDNLKYSAAPLPCDERALAELTFAVTDRPRWVYASTHDGEEDLACRIHKILKEKIPDLLTIIVPRHPERRGDVADTCFKNGVKFKLRSENMALPTPDDDIYIADTLGELGLFYTLCDIAMIGRSFSSDGGGGHNPIEAAQLDCAVITGPNNQFQQALYDDMKLDDAVTETQDQSSLIAALDDLLSNPQSLLLAKEKTRLFVARKTHVIEHVLNQLSPLLKTMESRDAA